jgi:hypothetical protein
LSAAATFGGESELQPLNELTIRSIQEALTPLAQKLGEGAAQLYAMYVHQITNEARLSLIMVEVLFVIWLLLGLAWLYVAVAGSPTSDTLGSPLVALKGGFVLLAIFGSGAVYDGILKLQNPQYHALDRIITQVRGRSQ